LQLRGAKSASETPPTAPAFARRDTRRPQKWLKPLLSLPCKRYQLMPEETSVTSVVVDSPPEDVPLRVPRALRTGRLIS
jgi:hypothetical protein